MPSRPDLRELVTNVKDAFGELDRETLLDILTFVVKEYVVEGPPPMLVHQAETLADLEGKSFAQIVAALQTRFDHPELQLFTVDGEQVSVRVGGVIQPLLAPRTPLAPLPAIPPVAAEVPRQAAGVRVVETNLSRTPPPVRELSLRGRPAGEGAPPPAPPPSPAAAAPTPAAPTPPAAPAAPDKPEASGDDASARFSLLELD